MPWVPGPIPDLIPGQGVIADPALIQDPIPGRTPVLILVLIPGQTPVLIQAPTLAPDADLDV